MGVVSQTEYQGRPVLVIKNSDQDKYPFQFGLKKAMLIVEHFEDIKKFIEDNKEELENM